MGTFQAGRVSSEHPCLAIRPPVRVHVSMESERWWTRRVPVSTAEGNFKASQSVTVLPLFRCSLWPCPFLIPMLGWAGLTYFLLPLTPAVDAPAQV